MVKKRTVLLVGVGSLLGRCVLDTLEGRRGNLRVIGGDADPAAAALGECDAAVLLPTDDDPEFVDHVVKAVAAYEVDLVVPCRDPANAALAMAADSLGDVLPLAAPPGHLVDMTRNKASSATWCTAHGIAHAPTLSTDACDPQDVELVRSWGFPLIAKPASGSGSLGVSVVINSDQLEVALSTPGLVIQPFLDPPDSLVLNFERGLPLFWEVPCVDEPGVMALFGPNGEVGPFMCFSAQHRLGRNEALWVVDDPSLHEFAERVVQRFADAGWRGPLNLQVRRGVTGWQVIEINARFSGGTAARLHMGLDEVGWVVNTWLGADTVPQWEPEPVPRVVRTFREVPQKMSSPGTSTDAE